MIALNVSLVAGIDTKEELLKSLQTALRLEHATIPVYLQAAWSLMPPTDNSLDTNFTIREIIRDVALEEMLHVTLVANLINALGGTPTLNSPSFLATYPGHLPGSVKTGLEVHLRPYSEKQVREVFLEIEEPETPRDFPVFAVDEPVLTIGQFYAQVKRVITESDPAMLFTGNPERQIPRRIGNDVALRIVNAATALQAINLIVEQGEGTPQSPLEAVTGEPSHYYRFMSILKGKMLRADASAPEGFAYSGDAIHFDKMRVANVKEDVQMADLAANTAAAVLGRNFNQAYTQMLAKLHTAFNTDDAQVRKASLNGAVNLMSNTLPDAARKLMALEISPQVVAGPTWEYDAGTS